MKIVSTFMSFILIMTFGCSKPQPQIQTQGHTQPEAQAQSYSNSSLSEVSNQEEELTQRVTPSEKSENPSGSNSKERSIASTDIDSSFASQRLNMEEKIKDFVRNWNQANSMIQLVNLFNISKENKTFLIQYLKAQKIEGTKPSLVEYLPNKRQFQFKFDEGTKTVWILATEPSLVLYDQTEVFEYHSENQIRGFFPDFQEEKSKSSPSEVKKNKKSTTSKFSLLIQEAWAQQRSFDQEDIINHRSNQSLAQLTPFPSNSSETFYDPWKAHNDQVRKEQEKLNKFKKKEKKSSQNVLMALLIGLGSAIVIPPILNKGSNLINNHWGTSGRFQLLEDISKLKEFYAEIDNDIFDGGPIIIKSFECEAILNKNSPASKVHYQYPDVSEDGSPIYDGRRFNEIIVNLNDSPTMKDDLINSKNNPNLGKKIKALERCCQNIPCEDWLNERLSMFKKELDGTKKVYFEPITDIDAFIKKKEDEARGKGSK